MCLFTYCIALDVGVDPKVMYHLNLTVIKLGHNPARVKPDIYEVNKDLDCSHKNQWEFKIFNFSQRNYIYCNYCVSLLGQLVQLDRAYGH